MRDATAGDPVSGLKWSHKALRKLRRVLRRRYHISAPTISRLLRKDHYSLRVNSKRLAGHQHPGRDEQFSYIVRYRQAFLRRGWAVISVDSKKRELVGPFKNTGRAWRQSARAVNMYDFRSDAVGVALLYGVYDVGRNRGYMAVGISHDTAEFAVATIRAWWFGEGRHHYGQHRHLLIEADCGGSNGNRNQRWRVLLQEFADETRLVLTVTHYPTGASKWNLIEHRMFNEISANWAAQPLDSYETVLKHLRTTSTTTGFRCRARLDPKPYQTGIKVSKKDRAALHLRPHKIFPHWNYTIYPRTPSAKERGAS
jgi:Rhodopirellula transposase DDE domain